MKMTKALSIILILALAGQAPALELARDEDWSGTIELKEDIIVPSKLTLTLKPGTQVITNGHKIISYGIVDIQGQTNNEVKIDHALLCRTNSIEVISLRPYQVDTEILKEEFNTFKVQYAILWSLLFASTFFMLEAR